MTKKVIFDGDGTLYDSGRSIKKSCNATLKHFGYAEIPYSELDFFVGPPLKECFRLCHVREEELDACMAYYRSYQKENCLFDIDFYEDVFSSLEELKNRGYLIYLGTSRAFDLGRRLVAHCKIDSFFSGYYGANSDGSHASKQEVIIKADNETPVTEISFMVGDTSMDILAGKNVSYQTIGCLYGYGNKDELRKSKPDYLINHFKEILKILK